MGLISDAQLSGGIQRTARQRGGLRTELRGISFNSEYEAINYANQLEDEIYRLRERMRMDALTLNYCGSPFAAKVPLQAVGPCKPTSSKLLLLL